jgi:hypothetical protein
MRTIPCQAGGNLLEGLNQFLLKKTIARRFINLGLPIHDACNFADKMTEGTQVVIVRDPDTRLPDFVILLKLEKED